MYGLMAALMATGMLVTLLLPEAAAGEAHPNSLKDAVVLPFVEFFRRSEAVWILLFILLYKLGDTVAGQMTTPFYLEMGFSKTEIGAVVKLFGFWATVLGGLAGGALILRYGIYRTLW
ncbi:hypothetical protein, partial [Plasmodium yoelii yoelii]